jgi:hypothetical protein
VRRLVVGIKSMMPQSINKRHAVAKSTGVREPKAFVLPGVSINIYIYNGETCQAVSSPAMTDHLKITSTTNTRSTPLLSDLTEHERDAEGCMPCSVKLAVAADDEESNDDSSQYAWWFDNCGLPAILLLQFGMTFSICHVGADNCLRWSLLNYSIVMFVITAALYRRAAKDCNLNCSVAFLLPEVLVAIVMGN